MDERQETLDAFYFQNGLCCAGCDWWRSISSLVGDCTKSAPVSGHERLAMIGISRSTLPLEAGHVITKRDHACGDFRDDFDWSTLPLGYLKRVGAPLTALRPTKDPTQ